MAAEPLLLAQGVVRRFGGGVFGTGGRTLALRGVDLAVAPGEVVGIVGESGCGKSTLARILIGLDRPDEGTVRIAGQSLAAYRQRDVARIVQPVFQDPYGSLNPSQSVAEILSLPLRLHTDLGPAERARRIEALADDVGLPARVLAARPRALSGGQRQRVAIARALAGEPRLLICDEPTSALDVSVQAQILNLLADLNTERGVAIVLISHDLAVVEHLCDRVVVMYAGRIVEEAPASDLMTAPRHPYTAALKAAVFAPTDPLGLPDLPLGAAPPPLGEVDGCALAPRCPNVGARCHSDRPELTTGASHRFACHHPVADTVR